jgi:hypothetical protein
MDELHIKLVKDSLNEVMNVHVQTIRMDINDIKDDIKHLKQHGCTIGAKNVERLNALDKRASSFGALFGAVFGGLIGWLGRNLHFGN